MGLIQTTVEKLKSSATALRDIWIPKSEVEIYLRTHTKNPYVANILVSSAQKNGDARMYPEEIIERIENDGLEGVIAGANSIRTANVWPGGVGRGFYLVGRYRAQHKLGIKSEVDTVASVGIFTGAPSRLDMQEDRFGIDTSPDAVEAFAYEIVKSLGPRELFKSPESRHEAIKKRLSEVASAVRGYVSEGFMGLGGVVQLLEKKFGHLKMGDVQNFYVVAADYDGEGNNRVVYSSSSTPDKSFPKVMIATIALPTLFDPVRDNGHIEADGGLLEAVPLAAALIDAQADLAIGTALNYKIPKGKTSFKGFVGKVGQGDRNFVIMSRAITYWMMMYLTQMSPGNVARIGDKYGKVMLDLPDLRDVPPFDLYDRAPQLVKPGEDRTTDMVARFFNPKFAHPEYNADHFIRILRTSGYKDMSLSLAEKARLHASNLLNKPWLRVY